MFARAVSSPDTPAVETVDFDLGDPGSPLPARLYVPSRIRSETGPLIVYFHGGGWVVGSIESPSDRSCRHLADRMLASRVLAVDYRLAPEDPFPGRGR